MRLSFILLFFLQAIFSKAQTTQEFSGDLKGARNIELNKFYKFPKTPIGHGTVKEFQLNRLRSLNLFLEERNTTWFIMEIPYEGVLTLEISPHHVKDDYDWMIYNFSDNLSKDILSGKAEPIRTNNAKNDKLSRSKTGLKTGSVNLFAPPGPGNSYSKPLEMKKGDKLILVIDNIYKKGGGFDLKTQLIPVFRPPFTSVEGYVLDKKTKRPLAAQVIFEDDTSGVPVLKVNSDPVTGFYKASVPLRPLNGLAKRIGYLLKAEDVIVNKLETVRLDFLLDTIAPGQKMVLFNIHFSPNSAEFLENSKPDLKHLLDFLIEQPDWQIKIVGHTNHNAFANERYLQKLSFDRALAVKKYLLSASIPERRMSCAGQGGNNPLFNSKDPAEGMKNLRVEVTLTKKQ